MEKLYYFLPSVLKNWLTTPDSDEEEEVAAGATEEEEVAEQDEVAPAATEQEDAAPAATEQEDAAPGATEQEDAAPGATEQEDAAPGATEQEDAVSGAAEQEEVAPGAMEQEEVGSGTTEQGDAATELPKQEEVERDFHENICGKMQQVKLCVLTNKETRLKGQTLARQLYHQEEFRCPKTIRELSEDLELAEVTVKAYVTYFKFGSMSLNEALRTFLKVLWPEDELEIQHLLITHFSHWYLMCTGQPLGLQTAVYNLSWAMIILNADLNGSHKGRKMTCEEFLANLSSASCDFQYPLKHLKNIYKSIKTKPLKAFRVKTRCRSVGRKETSIPEDSGCKSSFGTDNNPTTTVHKTGNLICKRVTDENGRKTKKCQRAWKPFTAVLKGMVLHLQKDTSDLCEADNKNAIRLHHAMAYPVDYKKRPHVLCLKTAHSRFFYFQAESEVEQTSWVAIINRIAARYSAPPLTSASHSIKTHHPQVLPSFPTTLSLEQQLEYHKDQLQRVSEHIDYYLTLPLWDGTLSLAYMEQEVKRYTTYVRALQELAAEEDAGEGCTNRTTTMYRGIVTFIGYKN
ncbi:PH and SEC7 domain-containing protein 1-like [Pangasianodon hypophthalmus]|uniref:PH and SEC7 domain-containing protein 1-like n=1 Tax=Pangasianodon hypophthalmus TaxID=310915 RepID=UPI0023071C1D|nr:PH and SEC7 domain-containing protein 1-like [Pangasianodon hypophthalmus]